MQLQLARTFTRRHEPIETQEVCQRHAHWGVDGAIDANVGSGAICPIAIRERKRIEAHAVDVAGERQPRDGGRGLPLAGNVERGMQLRVPDALEQAREAGGTLRHEFVHQCDDGTRALCLEVDGERATRRLPGCVDAAAGPKLPPPKSTTDRRSTCK
jgi:hypothetical protein